MLTRITPGRSQLDALGVDEIAGFRGRRTMQGEHVAGAHEGFDALMVDRPLLDLGGHAPAIMVMNRHIEARGRAGAVTWPTRPMPMIPRVFPVICVPTMKAGLHRRHCRARIRRSPSAARRAAPSISNSAISAVASLSTSGVLVTMIPLDFARVQIHVIHADGKVRDGFNRVR